MSKLTRAIEELSRRADAGDNASLMFLHNTSADKLQRIQDMGGMPMPSIAITEKDIPFENFGDITLVGRPESFDPKSSSLNQAFSADAYTVRAPRPVRIAKKGAGKRFKELYGADAKELDVYADDTAANVWDLEKKGDVREDKYDQVVRWFDRWSGPIFLKRKGIEFNKDDGLDINEKLQPFKQSGEFKQWAEEAVDDLFEDGEYFVANPNRDYYTQKAKLMPYTADEIAKVMKRSAGRGGEGGMSTGSPGAVRAAYSEKLTSLDAIRKRKDQLSGDISIEKGEIENLLSDLGDALKPYYKYDPSGFSYREAVSELMTEGATRGLKRSADFVGFENIPQDLMSELEGFQQILKKAPTEYFESKPKRVVQLNEFGGAIVPEDTNQRTIDLLTRQGLEIERYTNDAQRLEAREKFKNLLFQLSPVAVTTVLAGIAAGAPGRAQAGPISSGRNAAAELAKRAAAGDIRAQRAIQGGYNTEAYTGTTYSDIREFDARKANPEGDWGRGVYASTSPADVSENYAGVGPDLTNRISQESERVADELADYPDDLLEEYGFTLDDYEADEAGVSEKIAAQRLVGDVEQGVIYPLQIDTRKYAQIGGKEPTVLRQPDYYARAEANLDLDDYDSIDDYEDAVREQAESYAMDDPESLYNKIREAVRNTDGYQDDMAIESVLEELTDDIVDGEVRVMDIDQAVRNNFNNIYDDNGDLVSSGGVSAQALENLGFEGVIDNTVNEKFGTGRRYGGAMAGVNADTSHIITFPKAENRIRSRFAQFDPDKVNSRDILAGVGGGAVLAGTMTPEEAQASQGGGLVPFDPAIHTPQDVGLGEPGSVSTEYIATVDAPDGSVMLIPTIWWDAEGNPKLFEREDTDKAIELAIDYEQSTGKQFPRFPAGAYAEADDYAISRSRAGGASQTPLARDTTTGMGGMGVRSAPVTQDEEAIIAAQPPAPTGADLMQQANDDFLSGIFNQPGSFFNPETYDVIGDVGRGAFDATTGFLGDMEQMLVGGIIQGIGGANTWEDALKMIGGGLGQGIINAPEGRGSRFMEGMKNYDPAFITSGEVGQVPGIIPSFGTQDEERTKRAKMLGGFFAPI